MKSSINIFSETGCIQHEVLWKYRQGKLSASEKHAVEVHLTDCELCSDALAGMMSLQSDEVIKGLRKSVKNISSPKKIIRFYDYRVLTAVAAAAAVVIVFTYMFNSSEKKDRQQIVQLAEPQAPKESEKYKSEKSTASDSIQTVQDTASTLGLLSNNEPKKNIAKVHFTQPVATGSYSTTKSDTVLTYSIVTSDSNGIGAAEGPAALNNNVVSGNSNVGSAGYMAPAQPAAAESRSEEKPTFQWNNNAEKSVSGDNVLGDKEVASRKRSNEAFKKSPSSGSSKIEYIEDLKVSRTPAMTDAEKADTIDDRSLEPKYENKKQKAADVTIGREEPFVYSKTLHDGLDYFHNKQYDYASQMFSIILEHFPNDVNSQFYKGLSEMEKQNYPESSTLLNQAMRNTDRTFYEEAKFKLALCYVAMNQKKDGEKLLREIKKDKGFYSKQASEELERLK